MTIIWHRFKWQQYCYILEASTNIHGRAPGGGDLSGDIPQSGGIKSLFAIEN